MFKIFGDAANSIDKNHLTGQERFFDTREVIVSKTDLKGRITYVNDVFLRVSGYAEQQLLGQPHSFIRHPTMPRCVFKLLWRQLSDGKEIFAYVNNRAKNGDSYWVFAHVTPSFDEAQNMVSYHSMRRNPKRPIIENIIMPLYEKLLAVEQAEASRKVGLQKSFKMLEDFIAEQGVGYDEFILSL